MRPPPSAIYWSAAAPATPCAATLGCASVGPHILTLSLAGVHQSVKRSQEVRTGRASLAHCLLRQRRCLSPVFAEDFSSPSSNSGGRRMVPLNLVLGALAELGGGPKAPSEWTCGDCVDQRPRVRRFWGATSAGADRVFME